MVLTLAGFESAVLGLVRAVVDDTNTIVDVLAELRSLGISGVTDLHTEGVGTHEAILRVNK